MIWKLLEFGVLGVRNEICVLILLFQCVLSIFECGIVGWKFDGFWWVYIREGKILIADSNLLIYKENLF